MKCTVSLHVNPDGTTDPHASVWIRKNRAIYTMVLEAGLALKTSDFLNSLPLDQGIYPTKGGWYSYDGFVEDGPHKDIETALKALKTQIMLAKKAAAEQQ